MQVVRHVQYKLVSLQGTFAYYTKRFIFGRLFSSFVLLNFVDDYFRRSKWTQIWPSFNTLDQLSRSVMISHKNDINLPNFRIFEISNHHWNQRARFNKALKFCFRNRLQKNLCFLILLIEIVLFFSGSGILTPSWNRF